MDQHRLQGPGCPHQILSLRVAEDVEQNNRGDYSERRMVL